MRRLPWRFMKPGAAHPAIGFFAASPTNSRHAGSGPAGLGGWVGTKRCGGATRRFIGGLLSAPAQHGTAAQAGQRRFAARPVTCARERKLLDLLAVDAADPAVLEQEDRVLGDVLGGGAVAAHAGVE